MGQLHTLHRKREAAHHEREREENNDIIIAGGIMRDSDSMNTKIPTRDNYEPSCGPSKREKGPTDTLLVSQIEKRENGRNRDSGDS